MSSSPAAAAIVLAFRWPWMAHAIYVLVALAWLVPDKRIEQTLVGQGDAGARD